MPATVDSSHHMRSRLMRTAGMYWNRRVTWRAVEPGADAAEVGVEVVADAVRDRCQVGPERRVGVGAGELAEPLFDGVGRRRACLDRGQLERCAGEDV